MSDPPEGSSDADSTLALSRRTLLGSAVSVGALGAASGFGTLAVLSDESTATENRLESGRMDLGIAWTETYNGEQVESAGRCGSTDPNDYVDNTAAVITLDGVEPGDEGLFRTCTLVEGAQSPIWVRFTAGAYREHGRAQVEIDAGDDTPDEGELQEHLDLTVWIDENCDGVRDDDEETVASDTFAAVMDGPLADGVVLDDNGATPGCLAVRWELPSDVPPTVLSDSVEFGIEFAAEQTRHDGSGTSPWGNA